ncbi:MAG: hypothetical protein HQK67_08065, partial [Desulfamplus sp.]|nr:hypothetical protein [Desulfamplus sp.]
MNQILQTSQSNRLIDINYCPEWLKELWEWADRNNIPDHQYVESKWHKGWIGLPRDKDTLLSVTELNLDSIQLTELPESIGNLGHLTILNLSFNRLSNLPESIGNLRLRMVR